MGYDAFLSYSREADEALAPALRGALHRVAKPWFKRRAAHVFLDRSSLAANPALWPSIERALRASRHFILLCSPASAASKWVERELECWLEDGSPERLLLVLTEGELSWDDSAGDFDWDRTTSIPTCLEGRLQVEPLYVDMRWARHETSLSLEHPRFLDAVISLGAPIRGIEKEELESEEVRQHRRTRRTASIAGVALVVLLAASVVFGGIALRRGLQLQAELVASELARLVAQNELGRRLNAEGNTGRALATLASPLPDRSDPRLAQAAREADLELARTLLSAGQVDESRFALRPVDVSETLALSNDGTRLAVHKSQISPRPVKEYNKVEIVDTAGAGKSATVYVPGTELVSTMSFVQGSRWLYVQPSASQGMIVDAASGETVATVPRQEFRWVAPNTARLFGYDRESRAFTVFDLTDGSPIASLDAVGEGSLRRFALTPASEIAVILYTDGALALVGPGADVRRQSETTSGRIRELYAPVAGTDSVLVSTDDAPVAILDAATGEVRPLDASVPDETPALAAPLHGGRIAYVERAGSSRISFLGASATRPERTEIDGRVTALIGTEIGDGVLAGDGSGEVHWAPHNSDRLTTVVSGAADPMTTLAVSARSGLLVVGHDSGTIRVRRAPGMDQVLALRGHAARVMALSLSEDGTELVSASADGTARRWWVVPPAAQIVVPPHEWRDGLNKDDEVARRRLALAPDGRLLALRHDDHRISVWSVDGKHSFTVHDEDATETLDFGFTPDSGRLFVVDNSGGLGVFDAMGKPVRSWRETVPRIDVHQGLDQPRDVSPFLAFAPDGSTLVTTANGSDVYLWDLSSSAPPSLLAEDLFELDVSVRDRAKFSGQEMVWRGGEDVQVWSLAASTPTTRVELDPRERLLAVDAASGRAAVGGNDGAVRITGPKEQEAVHLAGPTPVTHAWFSADGSRLLTANQVGLDFHGLTAWDARDGRALGRIGEAGASSAFSEVVLGEDGTRCLTRPVEPGPTALWNTDTGERIASLGPDFVAKLAFSPDGSRFFIASSLSNEGGGGVWLHDAVTGDTVWEEVSWILDPGGVSFSPKGARLVVYDRSNSPGIAFSSALLVDVERGELVADLSRPPGRVLDAVFDASGRYLFVLLENGAVMRWRMMSTPGEARKLARSLIDRWQLAGNARDR